MMEELEYRLQHEVDWEILNLGEFGIFIGPRESLAKMEELEEEGEFYV